MTTVQSRGKKFRFSSFKVSIQNVQQNFAHKKTQASNPQSTPMNILKSRNLGEKLFQFWVKTNLQHINDVFIVFSHALLLTFPYIYGDI